MKAFNLHVGLESSAEKEACVERQEGTRGNRSKQADRGMGG